LLGDGARGSLVDGSGAKNGDEDIDTELSAGDSNGGGLITWSWSESCCGQGFEYLFIGVVTGGPLATASCASLEPSAWKKTEGLLGSGFLTTGSGLVVASLARKKRLSTPSTCEWPESLYPGDRTRGVGPLDEPLSLTMLRACPTLGLLCAPAPIPKPAAFPVRSFVLLAAATTGLPLMLFGDMPDGCEAGILLGLSVREVRIYDRGVMFTFRSPSLLLLLVLVSATFT
jgi:hypothetical protein